jgi:hypothetical protein
LANKVRPSTRDNTPLFALRLLLAFRSDPFQIPWPHPHQQDFSQCAVCSLTFEPQSFESADSDEVWPILVACFRFHHNTTFAAWSHQLHPHLAPPRLLIEYGSCVIVGLQDTAWGAFAPGVWVDWLELYVRGAPRNVWQSFREGLPYLFDTQPIPRHNKQGPMFLKQREQLSELDQQRLDVAVTEFHNDCSLGKQEGRLSFRPPTTVHLSILTKQEWVRAPGDLHSTDYSVIERPKHRQLSGAKAAGLSEAFTKAPTQYPTIHDAISLARHDCRGRRDDIKKAFKAHVIPWWQRSVVTTRHPVLSIYVQHTYLVFGVVPGPQRQMLFSSWVCEARAQGYGSTAYDLPKGQERALALSVPTQPPHDRPLRPLIVLMDDFFQHGIANDDDDSDCRDQLLGLLRHIYSLSPFPPVDPAKSWAGPAITVFGHLLDANRGVVGLPNEKAEKYATKLRLFLHFYDSHGYVTRLEMARITGFCNCIAAFTRLRFYLVEFFEVLYPKTTYGEVQDWKYIGSPTESLLPPSKRGLRHKVVAWNRTPVKVGSKFDGSEKLSPHTCEPGVFNDMLCCARLFERSCRQRIDIHTKVYLDRPCPGVWFSHGVHTLAETPKMFVPGGKFTDAVPRTCEGFGITTGDAAFEQAATTHAAESTVITYDGLDDVLLQAKNIMPLEALVALWSPIRWEAQLFDTCRGRRRLHGVWHEVSETEDRRVVNLCDNEPVTHVWTSGITSQRFTLKLIRQLEVELATARIDMAMVWTDTNSMPADRFTRSHFGYKPWTQAIRFTTEAWSELCTMLGWLPEHEAFAHVGNVRAPTWNSPSNPFNSVDAQRDKLLVNAEFRALREAITTLEEATSLKRCAFVWPPEASSVLPNAEEIRSRLRGMGFNFRGRFEARRSIFESPPTTVSVLELASFDPLTHVPCGPLPWNIDIWTN